jgi:hypothetical protein
VRVDELLAALPALPDLDPAGLRAADLLLVKQFAAGCRELAAALPPADRKSFGPDLAPEGLEAVLGLPPGEGLCFEDAASPELAAVRKHLGEIDARLEELRARVLAELASRHCLDFGWREFLVVKESRARSLDASLATLEPCDSRHVVVRPALPPEGAELAAERRRLVARERRIEAGLVRDLARAAAAEAPRLRRCARAAESVRKPLCPPPTKSDSERP